MRQYGSLICLLQKYCTVPGSAADGYAYKIAVVVEMKSNGSGEVSPGEQVPVGDTLLVGCTKEYVLGEVFTCQDNGVIQSKDYGTIEEVCEKSNSPLILV